MCTIIPRQNFEKRGEIELVNRFLHGAKRRLGINVIDLGAIHPSMCYDRKHLNHAGIRILINVATFALTDLFPAEENYNTRRNSRGGGRGRNRGQRNRGRGGH